MPSSGLTYTDTIAYSDADLQATEATNLSAGTTTWSYDAGGRVTQLQDGGNDSALYSYAYDGTMDGETAYDAGWVYGSFFAQTLDGDYHVTSDGCNECSTATGGAISHTFTYQYDAAGRLIFINATGGYPAYQTYDQDGNRIAHDDVTTDVYTSYTYNADNSIATTILSGTPVAATYDIYGAGVMTGDGCATWGLDTFDRATSYGPLSGRPAVCPTVPSATYTHDANGTMLTSTSGGTTTTLHDDPTSSTPIVENVGSTTTAYVLDSNGTPLEAAQGSTAAYLVDDPKGDVSTVMEPGTIIYPTCQLQYDPYGTAVFTSSATNLCETGSTFVDLLYQNGRRDSASGTYQLGSRTYDPSKNSFLSPDHYQLGTPAQDLSIGTDPLTENAYTFVDGDPVNQFDPTGHMFTTGTEGMGGDQTCTVCHTYATAEAGKTRAQVTAIRTADVHHDDAANAAYKAAEQRKAALAAATAASAARPDFQDGLQGANYVPGEGDCQYANGGQVVCPDYAGNYDLTSAQYDACPGCAPGDPQPQRTTWGDVVTGGSILVGIAWLPFGEGEVQLPAEFAWLGTDSVSAATDATAAAADSTPQVLLNQAAGNEFRDQVAQQFTHAGYGVTTEVPHWTPFGWRITDIEVTSPDGDLLGGVETKLGSSPYTAAQQAKDAWLTQQGYPTSLVRGPYGP